MASAPPLVVDFLPTEALGLRGRLGLCMAPGRRDGVHSQRELLKDLRRLRHELQTDLLVTLLSGAELSHLGVPDLFARAAEQGLVTLWFPMGDQSGLPSRARVLALVDQLLGVLLGGSTVVLHCREGRGRSGLIAAACLVSQGQRWERALSVVRQARPGAVETPAQEAFLRGL